MTISKQKLLNFLNGVQVNSGNEISLTGQLNFKDNYIYQFNNEIVIYNKFFDESLNDNFSLSLQKLTAIISKLKDDNLELNIEDNIKLISKKSEIEFTKQEIKQEFTFKDNFEWQDLPENFLTGIEFAEKIIDENNTRFLPNIFIDNDKIVSTNGRVLIIYNLHKEFNKFFLKKLQIDLLLKFKVKKYCIEKNLIYFLADDTIIYFNYLTDCNYPDYTKIQLENEKEINFLDKLNLNDIDVNVSILDSESKVLKIEIEKNKIKIENSNIGINIKTKLDKENEIENIKFSLNADYLISFLKSDFGNDYKTYISDSMICFQNNDVKFITMLME